MQRCLAVVLLFVSLSAFGRGQKGDWIAGGGFGLTMGPTLVLLSPELEYIYKHNMTFGGLIQMGFGDGGVLFTSTGTVRYLIGTHPRVRPTFEGGLGLAVASGVTTSSFGIHILAGMGLDYFIDKDMSVGTMVRLNFAPPLKAFFLSWPIIVVRYNL